MEDRLEQNKRRVTAFCDLMFDGCQPAEVIEQTTGMSPLQFVTRARITGAQQLIRETSRRLIEIALEVGYTSPSHFAQVFRRFVGVTPREFRNGL